MTPYLSGKGLTIFSDILMSVIGSDELAEREGLSSTILDLCSRRFQSRCVIAGMTEEATEAALNRAAEVTSKGAQLCESPIERMTLVALVLADFPKLLTIPPAVYDGKRDPVLPDGDIVIIPQMAFVRHRIDFMVLTRVNDRPRFFAIECDGEEFHKNAAAMRARDAHLASWGIKTFHLTGTELYRDAAAYVGVVAAEIASASV